MSETFVPKAFRRKETRGIYMSLYATFYVEHIKDMTGKSLGEIVEELIYSQENFKEIMNDFFEKVSPDAL